MAEITVGVLQSEGSSQPIESRLLELEQAASALAAQRGHLLLCCELFTTGYGPPEQVRELAESADGPTARRIAEIGVRHQVTVVYGYAEYDARDGRLYNSCQVIDASGQKLLNYRKCHLPPGFEQECFEAGSGIGLFDCHGIRCGVAICFDIELPELIRQYAFAGTELLLTPTALTAPWHVVAKHTVAARAFENGLYIAYANFSGANAHTAFCGLSCFCDPQGNIRTQASQSPVLLVASVDTMDVTLAREKFGYLQHAKRYYQGSGNP